MMDGIEMAQRERVVAEARSWIGTPYHSGARLKGVGVDCAQLPAAVYRAAGMIDEIPVGAYSAQWHLHHSEELYLAEVMARAHQIDCRPAQGDFVLFRVGHCMAHGAIVVEWPVIIHAVTGQGVRLGDAARDPFARKLLIDRDPRYFTLWGG